MVKTFIDIPFEWAGDSPYFLVIAPEAGVPQTIDLDERGWSTTHAAYMRCQGTWHLMNKEHQLVFSMVVWQGEQPYYTARHIGRGLTGVRREVVAYGIGKKRLDGHVDRMWILPNGQICGGDDVEILALSLLDSMA